MHRLFKKEQILTVPNFLSLLRLLMIPVIVWLYCRRQDACGAAAVILLSGLTDIADGIIARKCNMISDLGKILDPVADKLTQMALMVCLISQYPRMVWLLGFFVVKEMAMGISGLLVIKKKDVVNSAQWFGKLSTAVLYAVMMLLFLLPEVPAVWADGMIFLCGGVLLLSLVKYLLFHGKLLRES